ncbi:unnamed protein product [Trichogramma brassicae]|uniref:Uncharacterized protein n=1 Tax=Trichogramma brassicae TaxID=86971 RepID=A0A6H5HW85_9HYME|nr:unnamed protein product [Trichogramma brassicae]
MHGEDLSEPPPGRQRQSPDDLRHSVAHDTVRRVRCRKRLGHLLPHHIFHHTFGSLRLSERSDLLRGQLETGQRHSQAHGSDSLRREAVAAHHRLHDFIDNYMDHCAVLLLQQDDELVQDAGHFQNVQSVLHHSLLRLPRYLALPVGCGHVLLVHGAADARRSAGGHPLRSDSRFLNKYYMFQRIE